MVLKRLIIHELEKESGAVNNAIVYESESALPIDEKSIVLIEKLNKSFNKDGRLSYAKFNTSPDRYFPEEFFNYNSGEKLDSDFIKFTIDVTKNLKTIINSRVGAKGGYLVYAEYDNSGYSYTSIYLVRDAEGILFNKEGNSYTIEPVDYLNTDKLAMACRINHNKYQLGTEKFLTFTKHTQQTVSDYFYDWISVDETESSVEYTKNLYEMVSNMSLPYNKDTGEELSLNEYRDKVYNYIQNNDGLVNLNQMGLHFYDDETIFVNYAIENDLIIDNEFKSNKSGLRNFIKLLVSRDGIKLNASRGDLGTKIRPGEEVNTIIIESQSFASAIIAEINEG